MSFNIYQLDEIEADGSEESERAFDKYQSYITEEFLNSEEGRERLKDDPDLGFWSSQLVYYGYTYIGVTLSQMEVTDVNEILTDIFPRKISLQSPNDADDTIPELIAFWGFLGQTYNLKNAKLILVFLDKLKADFHAIMNDSSRFGMAKSFVTMAQSAGFDPNKQEDMNEFINVYNQNILNKTKDPLSIESTTIRTEQNTPSNSNTQSRKIKEKKKKIRKISKVSRQKKMKKHKR